MRSVNGTQGVTSLDMNWFQIIIQTLKYGLNKHGACWWRYHLHMVRMMPRSFTGVNFWDTSFAVAQKHLTYWPWRYQWWGNMCCSFGQNYYAYLSIQIYIQLTRASQILSFPLWFTMHKHRWSESNLWLLNAAGVDHLMTHVLPKNSWCSYLIIIITVSYGGCRKFLQLFGMLGPLALRPCALLRAWGFQHIPFIASRILGTFACCNQNQTFFVNRNRNARNFVAWLFAVIGGSATIKPRFMRSPFL